MMHSCDHHQRQIVCERTHIVDVSHFVVIFKLVHYFCGPKYTTLNKLWFSFSAQLTCHVLYKDNWDKSSCMRQIFIRVVDSVTSGLQEQHLQKILCLTIRVQAHCSCTQTKSMFKILYSMCTICHYSLRRRLTFIIPCFYLQPSELSSNSLTL